MNFSLAFSPCPNDTFIFDALVNNRIDTDGHQFNVVFEDVETLNRNAFNGVHDITKLSFAAYAQVMDQYELLDAGSALGRGCGPLLISKPNARISDKSSVALPGFHTTANLLFSIFYPQMQNKTEIVFSEIEDAVLSGTVDAGVIIHENRFTYEAKGLTKIADLGELWEKKTAMPIPLGGIVIRRSLPQGVKDSIGKLIRRSVEFAFAHPESSKDFVKAHSQEMDDDVIEKHIDLYVNKYSIDLGKEGKQAVNLLLQYASQPEKIS